MCLEETAYQRNIFVQGKNEEKKHSTTYFSEELLHFFNLLVGR